jgi:dTDP-4-dehydrorhamnose reductase
MKKILVLGDGLLGSEIVKQTKWPFVSREKNGIDFRDVDSYSRLINDYDEVINCIAHTKTYEDKRNLHWAVNYDAVAKLVGFCNDRRIKLIQISTDYLYTHSKVGSDENAVPVHCGNWYGYTKLLADGYIQLKSKNFLLIRATHKKYPFPYDKGWVNQVGNFDFVNSIASLIIRLVEKDANGLFNVGTEIKSMYDLGSKTNPDLEPVHMVIDETMPQNVIMDCSKMKKVLGC